MSGPVRMEVPKDPGKQVWPKWKTKKEKEEDRYEIPEEYKREHPERKP